MKVESLRQTKTIQAQMNGQSQKYFEILPELKTRPQQSPYLYKHESCTLSTKLTI